MVSAILTKFGKATQFSPLERMALFTSTGIETENLLVEERPVSGISSSPLCAITSLAVYFLHSTWPSAT